MYSAILLAIALEGSQPIGDIRPRSPGTNQAPNSLPILPQDEDWSQSGESTPAYKSHSLNLDGTTQASIGLNTRLHTEHFRNEAFGNLPGDDASAFFWAVPWASITIDDRIRVYGALKHQSVEGREGPEPGAINDTLDLHQGFVEVAMGDTVGQSRKDLLVRAGRQELHYGGGRLLAIRGGRFLRDDYDGALIRYRRGEWITDIFSVVGVEDGIDAFDNETDDSVSLSGVYSSGTINDMTVDLYGMRWWREEIPTASGPSEIVHSYLGTRLSGSALEHWSWEVEATAQFGSVEATNEDIRGFQIGGRIARPLSDRRGTPTPTLEFLYSTGDDDPTDGRIETFLAPAASGLVYEDVTQPLGPGNLFWAKASLPFTLGNRLSVSPFVHAYWRVEQQDALYTLFNTPLLPASSGESDFVGLDIGSTARMPLTDRLSVIAYGSYFDAGGAFRGTGRKASGSSAMLGLTYRY